MDLESVRQFCLSQPQATEQIQWEDDLVFKVGGKMFAVLALEPSHGVRMCFKCTAEDFAELTEMQGIRPAPYMARYKWVGLERLDALSWPRMRDQIRRSYEMVVEKLPKKVRRELFGDDSSGS